MSDVSDSGFVLGSTASFLFRAHLPTGEIVILQPYPDAVSGSAYAVSEQGLVVGQVVLGDRGRACIWNAQGVPRLLLDGLTDDYFSMATDITPDSTAIAGWVAAAFGARIRVFRFDEEGVRLLGEPSGSTGTQYAYAISGDGQTLGGMAMMPHPTRRVRLWGRELPLITTRGVLWHTNGTIRTLSGVNNGFSTDIKALSHNGRVAVGDSEIGDLPALVRVPVLWRDRAVQPLDNREGVALSVDAAGKRVVGVVREGGEPRAFFWTAGRGFELIAQRFQSVVPSGWRLTNAVAISPSGRYIVGMGVNPEGVTDGWVLVLDWQTGDVDENGCVDDADLLRVLFRSGQTGVGLAEDLNDDGVVDDADLLIVLFQLGQGC
ncbi:MAG: hypothetical protein NZ843_02550 [Fimbriimonadales bacterium]|nr:hypothetical protein [Fimbriimonadales bacterium]